MDLNGCDNSDTIDRAKVFVLIYSSFHFTTKCERRIDTIELFKYLNQYISETICQMEN